MLFTKENERVAILANRTRSDRNITLVGKSMPYNSPIRQSRGMKMVTGDFWVLLAMLLYFIVVVLIGFVYAKKSNASRASSST